MPGINENFWVAITGTFTKPNSVISVKQWGTENRIIQNMARGWKFGPVKW